MACTDNFIGIRVCSPPTPPKSGYYIDDLEGINVSAAADIATDSDAVNLLEAKIQFAIKQTVNDALAKLPNLQYNALAENLRAFCFSATTRNASPTLSISRNEYKTPLSDLVVNRIILKFGEAYVGHLEVLNDGVVIETIAVNVTADTEYIIDGLAIKATGVLSIRINNAGLNPYFAARTAQVWDSAVTSCCLRPYESAYITMSDGIGIVADVSVVCSEDKLLCRMIFPLKDAILYRSGIEVLNEWLATDRVNFLAVNGQEWAMEKKAEWAAAYNAKLSFALGSTLIKTLQKIDPVCFDCGGNKFGYAL